MEIVLTHESGIVPPIEEENKADTIIKSGVNPLS
jgi:hypothetical protein